MDVLNAGWRAGGGMVLETWDCFINAVTGQDGMEAKLLCGYLLISRHWFTTLELAALGAETLE